MKLRGETDANSEKAGCEICSGEHSYHRPGGRGESPRAQPEQGEAQHALRRRQLRPARQPAVRLRLEAAAIATSHRRAAPLKLVCGAAEGRHARGAIPADVLPLLEVGLDARGRLVAWRHSIVGQSISPAPLRVPMLVKKRASTRPRWRAPPPARRDPGKTFPGRRPALAEDRLWPVQWWRSSARAHRLRHRVLPRRGRARHEEGPVRSCAASLLGKHPRHKSGARARRPKVGGWGKPRPMGKMMAARAHRVHESFIPSSPSAVSRGERTAPLRLERVVCASLRRRPQPEHHRLRDGVGIGYGLSARANGGNHTEGRPRRAVQLPRLPVLRINRPRVESHRCLQRKKRAGSPSPPRR